MFLTDSANIKEVLLFPAMRPLGPNTNEPQQAAPAPAAPKA
jgi:hypothetical protein